MFICCRAVYKHGNIDVNLYLSIFRLHIYQRQSTRLLTAVPLVRVQQEGVKSLVNRNACIMSKLTGRKCGKEIVALIGKGCELEDISSLIPERLNQVIDELRKETLELISGYETFDKWFWIREKTEE